MAQRLYVNFAIYGGRIIGLRNLWEASTQYRGQTTSKPAWMTGVIVKKTQANWTQEPMLANLVAALSELFQKDFTPRGVQFGQVHWPVVDGDLPPEPGKQPAEWMKGHWYVKGNSNQPINVDIVQNGHVIKLANRSSVKPGDFVTMSGAVAVKQNDPYGAKCFVNNILFMSPGEEIAVGNSVTGAELMEQARAQGMQITGFGAGHGGSFGAQAGFGAPNSGAAPGGFGTPPAHGGGGFAPPPVQPPQQPPAQGGGFGSPQAPAQGGFAPPPNGFAPPR